jgi:hypothetical protein
VAIGHTKNNHFHLPVFRFQDDGWASVSGLQELRVDFALFFFGYRLQPRQDMFPLVVLLHELGAEGELHWDLSDVDSVQFSFAVPGHLASPAKCLFTGWGIIYRN